MAELLPEHVKVSIEKNVGEIQTEKEMKNGHLYYATARNQNGTFDSIQIKREKTTGENPAWKIQIKSGYPEHEQALKHNIQLQNQQSKDLDYKPTIER